MSWFKDAAERVIRTFLQAWLGAWLAISEHTFPDLWDQDTLLVGVSAAVLAILTALGASKVGNPDDASVLK